MKTYATRKCLICGKIISYNGLASAAHRKMHEREKLRGDEIVAAMIGTMITNNANDIKTEIDNGGEVTLLTRREMQFMAAADLGTKWTVLANGPTLIKI